MSDIGSIEEKLLKDTPETQSVLAPLQQPRKKARGIAAVTSKQTKQIEQAAMDLAKKEVEIDHLREDIDHLHEDNEELKRKDTLSRIRIEELVDQHDKDELYSNQLIQELIKTKIVSTLTYLE
jgi:hypothetical protein